MVVEADTGAVAQRLDYDVWGNVLSDTNPGFQPFGYAGGLFDPDTGLVRFGARDYDPESGTWTTKEPLGFAGGGTNFYTYAGQDPVNFIDPNGAIPVGYADETWWAPQSPQNKQFVVDHWGWYAAAPIIGPPAALVGAALLMGGGAEIGIATWGYLARTAAGRAVLHVAAWAGVGGAGGRALFRNALRAHSGAGPLTAAGRALTKHPGVVGMTKETLRQSLSTSSAINQAAANVLGEILRTGVRQLKYVPRYGNVIQYQIPGGYGARWYGAGERLGEFIGFISP
jgi:RHS repeat-associated protein